MPTNWVITPATTDQLDHVAATIEHGFCAPPRASMRTQVEHALGDGSVLVAHAEGDPSNIVGTSSTFPVQISLPHGISGQPIDVQGVTWIATRQDHRRKGILRELMAHMLADAVKDGVAWSALTSTEPGIYGRFGYGHAAASWEFELGGGSIKATDDELADYEFTIYGRDEGLPIHRKIWQESLTVVPGTVLLPAWKVDMMTRHDPIRHADRGTTECAVVSKAGKPVAAALTHHRYGDCSRGISVTQNALAPVALDDQSRKILGHFLCSRDLVKNTKVYLSGADDVLIWAAGGPESVSAQVEDGLLVRPVDLQQALASLYWGRPFAGVIELTDPLPGTAAKVVVQACGDGTVEVTPTDAAADLSMSAETLGMMSLGDANYPAMRHRGRYTDHRAGAFAECVSALRGLGSPNPVAGF